MPPFHVNDEMLPNSSNHQQGQAPFEGDDEYYDEELYYEVRIKSIEEISKEKNTVSIHE